MKTKILAVLLLVALLLTGCAKNKNNDKPIPPGGGPNQNGPSNITGDNSSYGEDLEDLGAFDGMFDGVKNDVVIKCESGTGGCYEIKDGVITFTSISAESVYSISGQFTGKIVINTGDAYKFELELCGFSLISTTNAPITVLSGDEVSIQAKKGTKNYIYDKRAAIPETEFTSISGAIYSEVDLEISGKGELTVVSDNNKGIHSKKDLQVKNLSLLVACNDNALKGNDSVSLDAASATLIASLGDGIKTSNSDISAKGNQRGTVSFASGTYNIYAACDGVDAAYNVVVDGADTVVNIFTDKYSNYSDEVTAVDESLYYIRFSTNAYKYSVKYYNSDSDFVWVNAEYHSSVSSDRGGSYYYYSFPRNDEYGKLQFFMYSSDMEQGQDSEYLVTSDSITVSDAYDTIALTVRGNYLHYNWTNYTTKVQGGMGGPGGGMNEGNSEKGDRSTKGLKAMNEITINDGSLNIKSYDDAIHANNDTTLENGSTPTGNVNINGGKLTVYSNDDGVHADGNLTIKGGSLSIVNSYEGAEGTTVNILGGDVSVIARDDGINATATSGTSITVSGGTLCVYCGGDGLDSNSRTSYMGIAFKGGKSLIITTSGGNSAIDSEMGYSYTAGQVVAIMPQGGMTQEATKCSNFSGVGKKVNVSLTEGNYLVCGIAENTLTARMPATINGMVVVLGDSSATVSSSASSSHTLNVGEFIWE